MCDICNGTGRVVHKLGNKGRLGASFIPCPNGSCQRKAQERTDQAIRRLKLELAKLEEISA